MKKSSRKFGSNQEIIRNTVYVHPGLRFHEIKKETKLANGTLQHHLSQLTKTESLKAKYIDKIPRYYASDIDNVMRLLY